MPLILEGSAAAAEIRAATAARAAAFIAASGRSPTLAAVAIETAAPLHFDVKQRAFTELGLVFQPHILPAGSTAADMAAVIQRLNGSSSVDGIFIQYPLPPHIDTQPLYDLIAPARDVDGARSNERVFEPATAEAVIVLLQHHHIGMSGRDVCIIRGDAVFADALAALFAQHGARPRVTTLAERAAVHSADIVVVATGVVNGINASAFRHGAVVVDVGYYHGGGRGDIAAHPDDIARMHAYATPRGSIGPLTVAILAQHTVTAAETAA